jgi:hypothetical protein
MYSILAATLLFAAMPAASAEHARIEDDYGRAVAEAKARSVPLVMAIWAPW